MIFFFKINLVMFDNRYFKSLRHVHMMCKYHPVISSWFNIVFLAICTRTGLTVFKITVCVKVNLVSVMVTAMFMITIMGKHMASMLIAEEIPLIKMRRAPGWNLRSGNLGLYPPVTQGLE